MTASFYWSNQFCLYCNEMRILLTFISFLALIPVWGQSNRPSIENLDAFAKQELDDIFRFKQHKGNRIDYSEDINLSYHRLHFKVDPAIDYITGSVVSYFETSQTINQINFDCTQFLQIDSVVYRGSKVSYTHKDEVLTVQFGQSISGFDSVAVYYQGEPENLYDGFGSFRLAEHDGHPVMWTLSQPYGAREWWPCRQNLSDKVDSLDMFITFPMGNKAAGLGVLESIDTNLQDSTETYHWKHRHPVTTYLIAFAVTNYAEFSDTAFVNGKEVEILNYVYPETYESAYKNAKKTIRFMEIFDSLFTPYPFEDEKYGHAQFSRGGGMEHQTMSFMGGFGFDLQAHELAHQWFGNYITCGDWADLWLNEGFATYLTGLCFEVMHNDTWWEVWKSSYSEYILSEKDGSVYVTDVLDNDRLFNSRLTYAKGAYVLHMLRWEIGDEAFFRGMNLYLTDPTIADGFARTETFIQHMNVAAERDLQSFFDQWVYGEGYPQYDVYWEQDQSNKVNVLVHQSPSHESVAFFDLPLEIQLKSDVIDTIIRFDYPNNDYVFSVQLDDPIDSLIFNPSRWILCTDSVHQRFKDEVNLSVFPNPVNDLLQVKRSRFKSQVEHFKVFDVAGQIKMERDVAIDPLSDLVIDLTSLETGIYVLELEMGEAVERIEIFKL